VSWRLGRADESSESNPAELTVQLRNATGAYSKGGESPNYPYVRHNVPVRLTVNPTDEVSRTAFIGFATGWTPSWEALTGQIPWVTLTASGTLRRLAQGAEPVISPIKRYLTALDHVLAYWPCEVGEHATDIPNAVGGGNGTWAGNADLASCSSFPASSALPTTNASGLYRFKVDTYTVAATNTQSVRLLLALPETASAPANNSVLVSLIMRGGTTSRMDLLYGTGSVLTMKAYDTAGATIATDSGTFNIDALPGMVSLEFAQSGATMFIAIKYLKLGSSTYLFSAGSSGTATVGTVSEIWIDAYQTVDNMGFGHVAVMDVGSAVDPLTDGVNQINAYDGETITGDGAGRLARVCDENQVALTTYGVTADVLGGTFNDYAGPQAIATVLDILHDCEDVEQGLLWDGLTTGLAYTTRRRHENAEALLTIDAAAGQLAPPFGPVDDDQRIRNRWTVNRLNGAEFTVSDDDGPMGTEAVGVYNDSKTINSYRDRAARDLADWLVHVGTIEGYRYPTLTVNLTATPELSGPVCDLFPGARVDITGLGSVLTAMADETVSLTVEGIQHDLNESMWVATLSCSPFEVWRVGEVAAETGDTGEFAARPDTDGSVLASSAALGATSLAVNIPTGPTWTTVADDYPLALSVGGVEVTATACTAAASAGGAPTVSARTTGKNDTAATSHAVTMPGGYAVGDKLLVAFTNDLATVTASTSSTGWSTLITRAQGSGTNHACTVFQKTATGSDGLTVNLSGSAAVTWAIVAVNGWSGTVEATGNDGASSTTVTPVVITPSGGTSNYLGIEVVATDASTTTAQALTQSSGYTNLQSQNPGITASGATFTAEQTYTSSSGWTPGTATLGSAEQWIAFTIAVNGSAAAATTQQTFTVNALPTARTAGAEVAVWSPSVLGL
jgi:hypothetical protein